MLSLKNYNPYPNPFADQTDDFNKIWVQVFPQYENYNPMAGVHPLAKISHMTGRGLGKVKNFFSKTETKAATLVAYWAADALVALALIATSTNVAAISLALFMFILHTYATFSVLEEIL